MKKITLISTLCLASFLVSCGIQKAIQAVQMATKQQFEKYDANKDGKLNRDELIKYESDFEYYKDMSAEEKRAKVEKVTNDRLRVCDKDGDKQLNLEEFQSCNENG